MDSVAPEDAIKQFAQLCAFLDDGLSTRDEILAAAGLNEAEWRLLCAHWLPQLVAGDAPELALSFAPAYARARRYPGGIVLPHASPVLGNAGPAELEGEDTISAPPPILDLDRTVDGAFPLAKPVLPFRAAPAPPPAPTVEPSEHARVVGVAADPAEATLEVSGAASAPGVVAPFSAPTVAGRVQRLQRFDTQTGALLPEPRWVDVDEAEPPVPSG